MPSLRVLIVEDSADDAELLVQELRRKGLGVVSERVDAADTLLTALQRETWDVVLADYSLPSFSGLAALAMVKEIDPDLPVIVVSGTIGEETAVTALRAGASDFLVKGRLLRLVPAIERDVKEARNRRERRKIERALEETRERMRFALEAAGVGIWDHEVGTGRATWSPVMEQLHGLPTGGFPGTFQAFADLIHPDDRARALDEIAHARREQSRSRVEYRTAWPDGSTHWLVGIGHTVYGSGDRARRAGVSLDITERKQLEEQLRQTQKLDSIGSLAAGVAHGFNNLLTIILAYTGMLAERLANDAAAVEDLEQVRRAAVSAASLTRQLLAFSRRQVLAPTVTDLNRILTNSEKLLKRLVEENVKIELDLADGLAPIKVDTGLIEQVLLNLVANARDAMPGGGLVSMKTENFEATPEFTREHVDVRPGPYVRLSVSDTGRGMTRAVQERLFEPFFTTKERGRGTGLGLATVHGIVKQSGGCIWVESEPGAGATFRICFPVAAGADAPSAPPAVESRAAQGRGTETVLVVEDSAPLRKLTERILRQHGYAVLAAGTAEDAERVCENHAGPIDVVLTDVVMPGQGGRAIAEWMAARRPDTKIIYMSGYTDDAIVRDGVRSEDAAFLQKPFSAEALLAKIREVLSQE